MDKLVEPLEYLDNVLGWVGRERVSTGMYLLSPKTRRLNPQPRTSTGVPLLSLMNRPLHHQPSSSWLQIHCATLEAFVITDTMHGALKSEEWVYDWYDHSAAVSIAAAKYRVASQEAETIHKTEIPHEAETLHETEPLHKTVTLYETDPT